MWDPLLIDYWFDVIPLTPRNIREILVRSEGEVTESELLEQLERDDGDETVTLFSFFKTNVLN